MCKDILLVNLKCVTTALSIIVIIGVTSFQSAYAGCGGNCSQNTTSSECSEQNNCNPSGNCTWENNTCTSSN